MHSIMYLFSVILLSVSNIIGNFLWGTTSHILQLPNLVSHVHWLTYAYPVSNSLSLLTYQLNLVSAYFCQVIGFSSNTQLLGDFQVIVTCTVLCVSCMTVDGPRRVQHGRRHVMCGPRRVLCGPCHALCCPCHVSCGRRHAPCGP